VFLLSQKTPPNRSWMRLHFLGGMTQPKPRAAKRRNHLSVLGTSPRKVRSSSSDIFNPFSLFQFHQS
jgi:hypothetical protein